MRRIELVSLRLSSFMGVSAFTLDLGGQNATVRGTNGVGKTTLATAFSWLITGKDSRGQADFQVKTLTSGGEELHNLEHAVEAVLDVDGELVSLKRAFREIWTKKRGSAREEFTGHENLYWIDGVPMGTKKEFDERVAELLPAGVWRELTNPDAWHAQHWQKRRADLVEMCGGVTDEDVVRAHPELVDLPGILGKRDLDGHRKVIEARRKEINSELRTLPVRIDEVRLGMPEAPEMSRDLLEQGLVGARARHQEALEAIAAAKAGRVDATAERRRLREVEDGLTDLERQARRQADERVDAVAAKARAAQRALDEARERIAAWERDIPERETALARLDERLEALRVEWREVNARAIEPHADDTCPACRQALPAEQVAAAHAAAAAELNGRKARELARISSDGEALKARRTRESAEIEMLRSRLDGQRHGLTTLQQKLAEAQEHALAPLGADVASTRPYAALANERDELQRRIEQLEGGDRQATEAAQVALAERVQATAAQVAALEGDLRILEQRAVGQAREAELAAQESLLTREFENLERELDLIERFVRAKSRMLTMRINSRFALTEFRLFAEQLNGGLADTCTALVAGVPYDAGLNRAARINSGLDVINVLQAHHGVAVPVFVDECESVVDLLTLDTQVVRLVVDERYPHLHVELEEAKELVGA